MNIKPEDLIITTYVKPQTSQGGMWCQLHEAVVQVHHKPSNITVKFENHRSQHRNKNEAMVILEDLLTEFKIGDIVVTEGGIEEIFDKYSDHWFILKNNEYILHTEAFAHTEEGYKYKTTQRVTKELDELEKEYEEKRKPLVNILRSLG